MALVIAHAELVSDQTSDPRTAPQRRREAVRLGAFQQQRLEAFELRGVQQRLTAGAAGLAQPGFAVTPVSSQPLADALPRDLQSPRCLGLTTALLDQPDCFETALLQGLEIPPYAFCISHTYKDVRTPKRCHFILRDSIVTGEFPFEGTAVEYWIKAPTGGRVRPLRDVRPDLPREFVDVVEHAIAPNPADRFHSVGEMEQALAKTIGTRPVPVVPSPPKWAWLSRPRMRWAVACAVVLFALASVFGTFGSNSARDRFGSGMSFPGKRQVLAVLEKFGIDFAAALPEEIRLAVLPFQPGEGERISPGLLDGFTEALTEQVSGLERFREDFVVIPAVEVFDYEGGDLGSLARGVGANLALAGRVFHEGRGFRAKLDLINTATGEVVGSAFGSEPTPDAAEVRDRLVMELAAILRVDLSEEAFAELQQTDDPAAGRAYGYYLQGRGYLQRHDEIENIDRAIQLFHRALGEDAQYAIAYAGLGEAYWRKHERQRDPVLIDRALQFANTAVTFGSDEPQVQITLGLIHLDTGRTEEALADFSRALDQAPRDVEALQGLARAYERSKAFRQAEDTLKKAIALRPNLWTGYKRLGLFYGSQGKFRQAIAQFSKVASLTPDNAQSFANLGSYHYFLGEFDEAKTMWERSLAIAPRYSALANLGRLLLDDGKFLEAAQRYRQAIELNPNNYSLWNNLAATYRETGDLEKQKAADKKSRSLAADALAVNPQDVGAMTMLAYHCAAGGHGDRARAYLEQARTTAPSDPKVAVKAAEIYLKIGEEGHAHEAVSRALAMGYSVNALKRQKLLRALAQELIAGGKIARSVE